MSADGLVMSASGGAAISIYTGTPNRQNNSRNRATLCGGRKCILRLNWYLQIYLMHKNKGDAHDQNAKPKENSVVPIYGNTLSLR